MSEQDLQSIFQEYRCLAAQSDELFQKVKNDFSSEVACTTGCSDCCHALFDLSLVEAMALNQAFNAKFGFGAERSRLLAEAGETDRKTVKLKRRFFQLAKQGSTDEEIMAEAAKAHVRCPLLGLGDECVLYEHRPITCRLYGVPTAIHGRAHACGKCGFTSGGSYPTVALDRIQDKLADMSRRLARAIGSRFRELDAVYVPVSMALLTKYDDAYLGVGKPPKE